MGGAKDDIIGSDTSTFKVVRVQFTVDGSIELPESSNGTYVTH